MIQSYITEMFKNDKEKINEISEFNKFTTYFSGYNTNRENMYTDEEKSTSIAYRLINENLPTFLYNKHIYKNVLKNIPEITEKTYKELNEYIQTESINDMFELEYFNDTLTQKGIEIYNIIISRKF